MTTDRRPAIFQIGRVKQTDDAVVVSGWGLNLCVRGCTCHRMFTGQLQVFEGQDGSLGLATTRPGCDCCSPWTLDELTSILAELAEIQAAPEVSR